MSEHHEQAAFFAWAACQKIEGLNHGYRTKATGAKLQRIGVKKGVPDIGLPVARGKYIGLYIELKVGKNKPTPEQRAWLSALNSNGSFAVVAYGWEQARDIILDYLSKPPALNVGLLEVAP